MRSNHQSPAAPAAAQTFDEELLLWLGDEPPGVRAADSERIRDIAAELALGFDALASVARAGAVIIRRRWPTPG